MRGASGNEVYSMTGVRNAITVKKSAHTQNSAYTQIGFQVYRQPLIFGLLRAALVGLQAVYDQFAEAHAAHTYRLTYNGQVCYLRAVLNDAFKSPTGVKFDIRTIERDGEWLYAITETGTRIPCTATLASVPKAFAEFLAYPSMIFSPSPVTSATAERSCI